MMHSARSTAPTKLRERCALCRARPRRRSRVRNRSRITKPATAVRWTGSSRILDSSVRMPATRIRSIELPLLLCRRRGSRMATTDPFDADHFREECGVFGVYGHPDAAALTALGLHALQHRGQEAAGIVAYDGE